MLHRSALPLLLGASLLLGSGCGGDGGAATSDRPSRDEDTVDDGKRDDSRQRDIDREEPTPGKCACDPNEVCEPESGECIALDELPEGELYGEVELLQQIFDNGKKEGVAHARFFVYEEPPPPSVQEYYTDDNELCLLYDGYKTQKWPQGRTIDAGELTFEVDDGEGPIVLAPWTLTGGNTRYSVKKDQPPADGDFFDASYLPLDASFTVDGAGGPDVGVFSFDAGRMPEDFTVDAEAELSDDGDLIVRWDPPQPAAMMEIIFDIPEPRESTFICTVRDDGEAKIPRRGGNTVQLRRTAARLATIDADGEPLRLLVQGRLWRMRKLCVDGDCDS